MLEYRACNVFCTVKCILKFHNIEQFNQETWLKKYLYYLNDQYFGNIDIFVKKIQTVGQFIYYFLL